MIQREREACKLTFMKYLQPNLRYLLWRTRPWWWCPDPCQVSSGGRPPGCPSSWPATTSCPSSSVFCSLVDGLRPSSSTLWSCRKRQPARGITNQFKTTTFMIQNIYALRVHLRIFPLIRRSCWRKSVWNLNLYTQKRF